MIVAPMDFADGPITPREVLLRSRIVLVGAIDAAAGNRVAAELLSLEQLDPQAEIALHVNSDRGSVPAALAVYDTMQLVSCPVATLCVGQARGVASLLLAAGAPGRRASLPHARISLHPPVDAFDTLPGPADEQAEEVRRLRRVLVQLYSRHCERPPAEVEEWMARERFMGVEEARRFGLVDRVADRPPRPWAGVFADEPG
jgi:ATP-dependent Clp protease protease subunit